MRSSVLRFFLRAVIGIVAAVSMLVLWIQVQQRIFYHRASALMEDMNAIHLHKSTWPDAQRMMAKWGRYGRHDGSCTQVDCTYRITLKTPSFAAMEWTSRHMPEKIYNGLPFDWMERVLDLLGCRRGFVTQSFVVEDSFVVRKKVHAILEVPALWAPGHHGGYSLVALVYSADHISNYPDLHPATDDFALHPDYSGYRPSGCNSCLVVKIRYSHSADPQTVDRLTSVNLKCFLTGNRCTNPEDLSPATAEFGLWKGAVPVGPPNHEVASACSIPIWARARDAQWIIAANPLKDGLIVRDAPPVEQSLVEVSRTIKGNTIPIGTKVSVLPFEGDPPFESPEHIMVGQPVLLLSFSVPLRFQATNGKIDFDLERCSVLADTPDARAQIAKGLSMNQPLRVPELTDSAFSDQ